MVEIAILQRLRFGFAGLLLAVAMGLCATRVPAQGIPQVVVGELNDADALNPFTTSTATGAYLCEYLYGSLLRTDKASGNPAPYIAAALPALSADFLSVTYTLHPNAQFSSGKRILARDIVFSYKLICNQFVQNHAKRGHFAAVADVIAAGEDKVTFKLTKPSAVAFRLTGEMPIVAADFFDPERRMDSLTVADVKLGLKQPAAKVAALKAVAERVNLFGTALATYDPEATAGSYVLTDWQRGSAIVLTANRKFWGKKFPNPPNAAFQQNAAEIRIEVSEEELTIRKGLFDNRFDVLNGLPNALFLNLSQIPELADKYDFITIPGGSYEYIGMNLKAPEKQRCRGLADLTVRQALARLVHVELLMVQQSAGVGQRIVAEFPASRPEFRREDLPPVKFDVAEAITLLDEAGWQDHDGNGLRDKEMGGEDVQLVLECIYNESKPERKATAEHLAANAREAGILVTVTPLPLKEYNARLKAGDYDLNVGFWSTDPYENAYRQIWHRKSWGKGSNYTGFGTEETDLLIKQYEETADPERQKRLCALLQQVIYETQPCIFLWSSTQNIVLKKTHSPEKPILQRPGFWIPSW